MNRDDLNDKILVIGYWPLVTLDVLGLTEQNRILGEADMEWVAQKLDDFNSGVAEACIWATWPLGDPKGQPMPVFVMHDANDIVGHIMMWSEGRPDEWFKLAFQREGDKYGIALHPIIQQTAKRFIANTKILYDVDVTADQLRIIFKPITFVTRTPVVKMLDWVEANMPERPRIGFIDLGPGTMDQHESLLDYINSIGQEEIITLGPFDRMTEQEMENLMPRFLDDIKPLNDMRKGAVNEDFFNQLKGENGG